MGTPAACAHASGTPQHLKLSSLLLRMCVLTCRARSGRRPLGATYEQYLHFIGFLGRAVRAFGETAVFRRGVKITSGFDQLRDDDKDVGEVYDEDADDEGEGEE